MFSPLSLTLALLSFVIPLVRFTSSRDRLGRRAKGALATSRHCADSGQDTDCTYPRHDLIGRTRVMNKQKKKTSRPPGGPDLPPVLRPLPVSFRTSAHRIFCWAFHSGHSLKRCSRVWFGYRHHHCWVGRFFVQLRYRIISLKRYPYKCHCYRY